MYVNSCRPSAKEYEFSEDILFFNEKCVDGNLYYAGI